MSTSPLTPRDIETLFGKPQDPLEVVRIPHAGKRLVMFYTEIQTPRVKRKGHRGVKRAAKLRTCAHCGRDSGTRKYCKLCSELRGALYQRKYQAKYRRERK